jgi:hypothetical protein
LPVMRKVTAFASFHPGSPAMGGDTAAHFGIGTVALKSSSEPCSHFSRMNSPFWSRGEWQSAHIPTCSTRYFPRATCAGEALGFGADFSAATATAAENKRTERAAIEVRFMVFTWGGWSVLPT